MIERLQFLRLKVLPMVDRLRYILLMLISVMLPLSYHPAVEASRVAGTLDAVIFHRSIQLVFVLLFLLLPFDLAALKHRFVKVSFALLSAVFLSGLLVAVLFGQTSCLDEFKVLCPPLMAMLVGMQVKWNRQRLLLLMLCFSLTALITGLSVLFMQGVGFVISEMYFYEPKNAFGPMLASAAVMLAFCWMSFADSKKWAQVIGKLVLLALVLLCVVVVLTIRARAALLAMVLVLCLAFFQRYKGKSLLISLSVCLLLAVAAFIFLPDSMREYVQQGLFAGLSKDFTSGRAERNMEAMALLGTHPLLGQLVMPKDIGVVHNFFLYEASRFGLLFALPVLALYVYLFVEILIKVFKSDVKLVSNVGFYVMLVLLLVSFFEYILPFGPGTVTFMNFVLFGMSLRQWDGNNNELVGNQNK